MRSHLAIEPRILYFGTPIALIATLNGDGSPNLAPLSSAWALGYSVVLGLGADGQTASNLRRRRELTINLPDERLWEAVERLAPLTGKHPVPAEKRALAFRFEPDKFGAAGLTPQLSEVVTPPRVREWPLQLEARVLAVHPIADDALAVEAGVERVHAAREIVVPGTNHGDPSAWRPLFSVFRHYFGVGGELGKTFRAET